MRRFAKDHFKEEWEEVFYYDETSPSGLRWKKPSKGATFLSVGDVAGYLSKGRWKVEYKEKESKFTGLFTICTLKF